MKKVLFLFAEEAFWGYLSPVSNLTELNLQRAISLLQCGQYDLLYVAVDHFSGKKKDKSRHYFDDLFSDFYPELTNKVYVSSSNIAYAKMFVSYLAIFKAAVSCNIIARINQKREVGNSIISANLESAEMKKPLYLNV